MIDGLERGSVGGCVSNGSPSIGPANAASPPSMHKTAVAARPPTALKDKLWESGCRIEPPKSDLI